MKNVQLVLGGDNIAGTDISLCCSAVQPIHWSRGAVFQAAAPNPSAPRTRSAEVIR